MGRPPLPIGTYGRILTVRLDRERYWSWANYRDFDGTTRRVQRFGPTKLAAENRLKEAMRDRNRIALDGEITGDSRVRVVAEMWFRELDESDRALRTKITYRDAWRRSVEPAVGELRLSDVRVSTVERVIWEIRQRRGSASAHHAKVVLSGVLGLAVRHDALDANPVRELTPARKSRRRARRSRSPRTGSCDYRSSWPAPMTRPSTTCATWSTHCRGSGVASGSCSRSTGPESMTPPARSRSRGS